jgi:hypothetical protein
MESPSRIVDVFPSVEDLKIDPAHLRVWRIAYKFKTELHGWQDGQPFVLTRPANKPVEGIAVVMAAAAHKNCIGIELTSCRLHSPLTSEPS